MNMWLLYYLLFSLVKTKMALYFGHSNELVSMDDVITEFQSSVAACFIRCQNQLGCVKAAFREEPIIGELNSCLLLKQSATSTNGEMISLVVTSHTMDHLDQICPRKQSIAKGRKPNPNCIIKSIDGGWSSWSNFTTKCLQLGGGIRQRTRHCNQPYPTYGGDDCQASDNVTRLTVEDDVKECGFEICPQPTMCVVLLDNLLNESSSGMAPSQVANLTYKHGTEEVTCAQSSTGKAQILLQHNKETSIRYGHKYGGQRFIEISYKNSYLFMRDVINQSASCRQGFTISSRHIAPSSVYFESYKGTKTYVSSSYCHSCSTLFKNDASISQGSGYIEDKSLLPLKGLLIGDIDESLEYAYVRFDPVTCIERIEDET